MNKLTFSLLIFLPSILASFTFGYLVAYKESEKKMYVRSLNGYEVVLKVPKTKEELRKQILINHAQASILHDIEKWWKEKPQK